MRVRTNASARSVFRAVAQETRVRVSHIAATIHGFSGSRHRRLGAWRRCSAAASRSWRDRHGRADRRRAGRAGRHPDRRGADARRQTHRLAAFRYQRANSTEGAPIRAFTAACAWRPALVASRFKETTSTTTRRQRRVRRRRQENDYLYSISFAVGLCAGEVTRIGRVWADGNLIDLSGYTTRFYPGDETKTRSAGGRDRRRRQFARLSRPLLHRLRGYGARRFRQPHSAIALRIVRAISSPIHRAGEPACGVALIPGAGEFVYATETVTRTTAWNHSPENAHNASAKPI